MSGGNGSGADLIVSAGCVITIDPERRVILDGAVAVSGNDIVAVDKAHDIRTRFKATKSLDYPNGILTPGLIDDKPQIVRLRDMVIPYEDRITEEEAYAAAVANFHDMIRFGTTSFLGAGSPQVASVARAVIDTGIRGVVTGKASDVAGPFGGHIQTIDEAIGLADRTFDEFHGAANGRLRVCYDLYSADAVSDELAQLVRDHARKRGVGIVSHFVQRRPEGDVTGFRNPQVARFAKFGLLAPDVTLAHMGWLPPADVEQIGKAGSSIAHCPGTSLFGGAGWIAHGVIPELAAAGANVALGTDAMIICRFMDMLRVMHAALGLADRIGSLEVGKAADLVVFDATHWRPVRFSNPVSDFVYSGAGSHVELVVIDGKIVHKDGKYIYEFDMEGVLDTLDRHAQASYERLGIFPKQQWPVA
jgi:5-methylthioadenosine/S-adenosylhomocysteine deaminase